MNFNTIHDLFLILSDEPDWEPYSSIITLASLEISNWIPGVIPIDRRLDLLIAALANFRFQQIKAGHNNSQYTYAGKMDTDPNNTAVANAERLFLSCLDMCGDIVTAKPFAFMSFSGGEEKLK